MAADVLSEVLRNRATTFVDVSTLTLAQGLLELADGQTDGPALSRLRRLHEDLADDLTA